MIEHIESFDISTKSADALSHAYKVANNRLVDYRPTSPDHKLLTKFRDSLLKQIKSLRTTPSIEELDAVTLAKLESINA